MDKNILVTGGSGLVGKHLNDILPNAIYISSKDYDLTDLQQVRDMMNEYKPNSVIHLAARVGGIVDNINYPVDYLEENVLMNTNVLKACHEFDVEKVIAILSTCIYPDVVDTYPMKEEDLFNGPPTETNFSYGFAKRCMAAHIDSYKKQYDKKWSYLIPCNLYGEYDKYEEHHSHFVSALIKKIYEADESIELWGTGKPLRQFMYGGDLARVIKHMLDNDIVGNFNVAPEWVHSINDLAEIGKKACLKDKLVVNYDNTKPDGQYRKDVDSSKLLSVLKDFNFTSLEEGIKKVYDNFSKRYNR
jgi:GDP-L-fucose synthase